MSAATRDPQVVRARLEDEGVTVHHVEIASRDGALVLHLETGMGLAEHELAQGVALAMAGVAAADFDGTTSLLTVTMTT